jgi:hypothetical protein
MYSSGFPKPEVKNELRTIHNFMPVPADKASNNIVLVSKYYCSKCLLNERGFTSTSGNSTYTRNQSYMG